MPAGALARTLRAYGIKTVLNLRGPNAADRWYRDELAATSAAGATHIDIALSSCLWMSRPQLRTVIEVIETAERPILIHCAWGSERTALVSAFAELLRPESRLGEARAQFSLRYLFLPAGNGRIMAEHLEQYAAWLRAQGLEHDRTAFRRWVNEGFEPRLPNRDQWPYDPYPLIVVKPAAASPTPQAGSRNGERLRR
jgi:hypothetical protein